MSVRILVSLLVVFVQSTVQGVPPNNDHVIMGRYQLAAMKGLEGRVFWDYKSDIDENKQCVMIVLDSEFKGDFLFIANRIPPNYLEIVCFEPNEGASGEWTARVVEFSGEMANKFNSLRDLTTKTIKGFPSGDLNPIHGDDDLRLVVGSGNQISDHTFSGSSISSDAKLLAAISKCVSVADSIIKRNLTKHIKSLKNKQNKTLHTIHE